MFVEMIRTISPHLTVLMGLLGGASTAGALEVGLAGVLGSKAMLVINGSEPRAIAVGQTSDGVRLVSLSGDQVVIEVDGKKRPLRVGQHAVASLSPDAAAKVVLKADSRGHFVTMGAVNGVSIQFMIDTGATLVSLGLSDALRLGIDPSKGQRGLSSTANGLAPVTKVKLDSVRIGALTLHNVDALIGQTDMPYALLGMSFLNRMEMQREGNTMTLKKQY
jgi:aspartyl protease family protein